MQTQRMWNCYQSLENGVCVPKKSQIFYKNKLHVYNTPKKMDFKFTLYFEGVNV